MIAIVNGEAEKGDDLMKQNKYIYLGFLFMLCFLVLTGCGGVQQQSRHLVIHWSAMNSGTSQNLKAIWGNVFTDKLYAVGSNGTILRYDLNTGGPWQPMTSPMTNTNINLNAIWGTSNDTLYAVGDYNSISNAATILKYTAGNGWISVSNTAQGSLYGVSGSNEDYFTVVGHHVRATYRNSWTFDDVGTADYYGLFMNDSVAVAVGSISGGTSNVSECLYDTWEDINNSPYNTYKLNAVFLEDMSGYIYVGDGGVILRSNLLNSNWNKVDSGTTENLNGVCAYEISNTQYAVVVGNNGTILFYNGTTSAKLDGGTTENLNGICQITSNYYVVGNNGVILHGKESYEY